ncbi:hypothetical protein NMY22_g9765 [Coprinellus aureogranulatus]|nr:hypothetical protein NMY22_g9765 [Coprinellus aureogranulatus]
MYKNAVAALHRLNAGHDILKQYKKVLKRHLTVVTAIANPNARGQSRKDLAWFWTHGQAGRKSYMDDLYRVSWLQAKARRDRWREELILLRSEMDWSMNYFKFKSREWMDLASQPGATAGQICYALRQSEQWEHLSTHAHATFERYLDGPIEDTDDDWSSDWKDVEGNEDEPSDFDLSSDSEMDMT